MTLSRRLAVASAVFAAIAAACGSGDDRPAPVPSVVPAAESDAFPVTIENCGIETTYDRAPTRAVTMNQHVTETLLALGLADAMVGTAFMDSTIRTDLAEAYATIEVLATEYPSREQVISVDPDIVLGGYNSAFAATAAGSREALATVGIDSHLTTAYCPGRDVAQTIDDVYDDITDLGAIFGVSDRAAALVTDIEATVASVALGSEGAPVDVFVYDSGSDRALTAGGFENTTALIELAGGRNVFDDVDDTFVEVSWEDVVDRDPDVIVILDYRSDGSDDKEAFLASHPIASNLRAVHEGRFVVLELTDVVPGVRNGDAVVTLAEGFVS